MNQNNFDHNNYEFNPSSPLCVYLLHGFSSTTYEVKALAEFLAEHGYHTIARNLPGHGTTIEECNRMKFQYWLDFVKKDIAELSSQSKKIFVIGNSMGAVLALYLASLFPLNGVVAGGIVLKFKKYFSTNFVVPIICRVVKTQLKTKVIESKQVRFYGYKEYPLIALNEYRKMIKIIKPLIKTIKIPSLIIHSNVDKTSTKKNIDMVVKSIKPQYINTLFVNRAHHNMFDQNPDQKIIFSEILRFLKKH